MPLLTPANFLTRTSNFPTIETIPKSSTTSHTKKLEVFHPFLKSWLVLAIFVILGSLCTQIVASDPYEVLGVSRDAPLNQIKRAYRDLAVKYHPDKNSINSDDSGRKFIELNQAFDILKSPERRSRYDQFGDPNAGQQNQAHYGASRSRQSHDNWDFSTFRTFRFYDQSLETLRRKSITTRQYHDYMRESKTKPFLIFFYANFCKTCKLFVPIWTKITDELAQYNISSFTIDVQRDYHLSNELGVNSIPLIACLVEGQLRPYYNNELSLGNIVKFVRSLLPNNLFNSLSRTSDQDRFIKLCPEHNRLSAILIIEKAKLRLRHHLLAFEFRFHYRFGVIDTETSYYKLFVDKYKLKINKGQSKLLVFDENYDKPTLNMELNSDNPNLTNVRKNLNKWPYLRLPRLSSQERFDDLCIYQIPRNGVKTQQRLCVILFASDTPSLALYRKKLTEFSSTNELYQNPKVVFAYIDDYKQSEFVEALKHETRPNGTNGTIRGSIVLIERDTTDRRKAYYYWLVNKWNPNNNDELNRAKSELEDLISRYKVGKSVTQMKTMLMPLIDEELPGLISRVLWRLLDYISRTTYYMTSQQTMASVLAFLILALLTSFFLYEKSAKLDRYSAGSSASSSTDSISIQEDHNDIRLIELKAETYNGMVRLLKPGHRSVVLLSDRESLNKLLPDFKKALWPYRCNKTLIFGHLCLDKNLDWYRDLLQQVLGVENLHLNKKKCIGTVLSLNGFRKYLVVYHAMHDEIHHLDDGEFDEDEGSFLGFDRQPLEKLSLWLDKMFDGLTKRYALSNWPDEIK